MSGWWSSLGFGRPAAPVEDDYADMGTAFGLDASMDTVPSAYLSPASAHPEAQAGLAPADRPGRSNR
jgi:hypothetical protein